MLNEEDRDLKHSHDLTQFSKVHHHTILLTIRYQWSRSNKHTKKCIRRIDNKCKSMILSGSKSLVYILKHLKNLVMEKIENGEDPNFDNICVCGCSDSDSLQ
jgi:hypothetical protein